MFALDTFFCSIFKKSIEREHFLYSRTSIIRNLDYPTWLKMGMSTAVTMDTGISAHAQTPTCIAVNQLSGWIKAWFIHSIIRHNDIQLSGQPLEPIKVSPDDSACLINS